MSGRTGIDAVVRRADECLAEQVLSTLDAMDATAWEESEEDLSQAPGAEPYAGYDSYESQNASGVLGRGADLGTRGRGLGAGVGGSSSGRRANRSPVASAPPRSRTQGERRYKTAEKAATGVSRYEPSPELDDAVAAATGSGPRIAAGTEVAWAKLSFRIWFDFDSAALRPEATATIAALAEHFETMGSGTVLEIVGHTDSRGSTWYNHDLSVRRARSVQWALERARIDPLGLSLRGLGESDPAYTNRSEWGRARNRRVEFRFYRAVAAHQVTH
jgi:outer membrane protein OmpA-like peptidoglycan-associated protein